MDYPWYNDPDDNIVWDDRGNIVVESCASHDCAERIVACVNACKDIPTEFLIAVDWQLAPKAGAKPVEVAKLLLKTEHYREALKKIATCSTAQETESTYKLALKHNNFIRDAQEALKP